MIFASYKLHNRGHSLIIARGTQWWYRNFQFLLEDTWQPNIPHWSVTIRWGWVNEIWYIWQGVNNASFFNFDIFFWSMWLLLKYNDIYDNGVWRNWSAVNGGDHDEVWVWKGGTWNSVSKIIQSWATAMTVFRFLLREKSEVAFTTTIDYEDITSLVVKVC